MSFAAGRFSNKDAVLKNFSSSAVQPEVIAPLCAVCGRRVDRITCEYDPFFRQFHFIAECHGRVEECDLDERLVMNADKIEPGEAFAAERARIDQRAKRLEER